MAFIPCLLFLIPFQVRAQEAIKPGETLDLERCIAIAVKNHPSILGAAGSLKASLSRVGQAQSSYYPQISASSGYSRNYVQGGTSVGGTGVAAPGSTTYNLYQDALSLNQTIFDFGKTSAQVDVQAYGADASKADLGDAERQIVFGVRQAYYAILQSKQSVDAFKEAVVQFRQHLDQAKRFYEVGTKAKIDVTNAEVNLGQARLNLINAQNALQIGKITLNNAMGVPDAPVYEIKEIPEFRDYPIELSAALKRGYEDRPDLQSARAKREAAQRSVDLAQKGYYPVLTGSAQYGWAGQNYPLDKEWTYGASLNFPLFSGFLTRSQVEEARANLEVAGANEELVRQGVRFDVEQAYYNLKDVRESISVAELTLTQAKENRELAQGRYASGVGNTIEVTDAVVSEISAKTAYITTLYNYHLAVASLEKAMGAKQ
ncbi:MAG TPA: TolC family protein [Desulfomonilia bacterium]|nr:TolC family protein [Desulfomonilia bacterium]